MADKQIQSDSPVWGYAGNAEQKVMECYNSSGANLFPGDVVIVDVNSLGAVGISTGGAGGVKPTTTASDPLVVGVISPMGDAQTNGQPVPPNASTYVCYLGVARVNIGAGTVAVGGALSASATSRQAAVATAAIGAQLGVALEAQTAKDVNNTIRAFIKLA